MTVFGSVIDQQKNPRHRQTFYEAIEKRLRLAVDPMQVLKNNQQGLALTLTDEHPLYRVKSKMTPLLGVHPQVSFRRINNLFELRQRRRRMNFGAQRPEQRKDRRDRILEHVVQFQNMHHHLLSDVVASFTIGDLKVTAQYFDQWKIRRRFPIRNRWALQHQPTRPQLVPCKFVHQTRFPQPRLAHHRQDLALAGSLLFHKFAENFNFSPPPD